MSTPTKECPFCSEEIKATAKKCRHCGEFLDGYTRDQIWRDSIGGDQIGQDKAGRDKISVGEIKDSKGIAVGREIKQANTGDVSGTFIQADGNVTFGKSTRDEQYEIVLHWDGKRLLREFDLSGRDLSSLDLEGADLRGSNLSNADLSHVNLRDADMGGANLRETDLSEAILFNANLINANLCGAFLHGASLSSIYLSKSDLVLAGRGPAAFRRAELYGAKYDDSTQWPNDFSPERAGAIKID